MICELSFTTKRPIAGMCGYGYTVAGSSSAFYFGSDLIHRLYHTDKIGEGVTGHYADTYEDCLQLAIESPELAVRNSATLRYFALDVYAFNIAVPGEGCTGEPAKEEGDHSHGPIASTTNVTAASVTSSASPAGSSTLTSAIAQETATPTSASAEVSMLECFSAFAKR